MGELSIVSYLPVRVRRGSHCQRWIPSRKGVSFFIGLSAEGPAGLRDCCLFLQADSCVTVCVCLQNKRLAAARAWEAQPFGSVPRTIESGPAAGRCAGPRGPFHSHTSTRALSLFLCNSYSPPLLSLLFTGRDKLNGDSCIALSCWAPGLINHNKVD